MHIKIIGAGGIGSNLILPLVKFLANESENHEDMKEINITVIDGDNYESRNRTRQNFHRLGNKAEVMIENLHTEYPNIIFNAKTEFVTKTSVEYLLNDNDIIFLAVDNFKSRKFISDYCEDFDNILILSGGNDYTDGTVQVFLRKDGKNLTLPLANDYNPEIQEPEDKSPDEVGCEEAAISEPQLIFTNFFIASLMLNAFYKYLQGSLTYDIVYGDIMTNNSLSVVRDK